MPALTGNGLAMRAGVMLELLSHRYDTTLLVIPIYDGPAEPPAELAARCRVISTCAPEDVESCLPEIVGHIHEADVVHVFRLALAPFSERLLREAGARQPPRLQVDLDDLESLAWRRQADLHRERGEPQGAREAEAKAARSADLERRVMRRCARVFLAAPGDADRLRRRSRLRRGGATVLAVPNAIRLPLAPSTDAPVGATPLALFVGTLGHFPNADAVSFFCGSVLPLLRASTPGFRLDVVGGGASEEIQDLGTFPGVQLLGPVADLASHYAAAGVVVVPLRSGGGTRIKILEAFAHGRPVVSTRIGAAGLDVRDGDHLLLADTAADFAEACRRVMDDDALARRLRANAHQLVAARYSVEAVSVAVGDAL